MKTVHYYPVDPPDKDDTVTLRMPKGAQLLTIMIVMRRVRLYALVDAKAPKSERCIRVVSTGSDIGSDEKLIYIGSCSVDDGGSPLVFHFFEKLSP